MYQGSKYFPFQEKWKVLVCSNTEMFLLSVMFRMMYIWSRRVKKWEHQSPPCWTCWRSLHSRMVLSSSKVGVQFIYKDFLVNPQISKYTTIIQMKLRNYLRAFVNFPKHIQKEISSLLRASRSIICLKRDIYLTSNINISENIIYF